MERPSDTSAAANARYLEALRRLTPEERLAAAAAMSEDVGRLVEAGVRCRHPEYGPDEVRAAVAGILLGPDLASSVRPGRATGVG